MKKTLTVLIAAAAAIGAMSLTSCGNASSETGTSQTATTAKADGIESIELKTTLLSGSQAYTFTTDGQKGYGTIKVSAEWPEKIGSASLSALTDTLTSAAFGAKGKGVKETIASFLSDASSFTDSAAETIAADAIPADAAAYTNTVQVSRTDLTPKYVTYKVSSYLYTGGAHGMSAATPITYDLTSGSVVTPATLFKAGSDSTIVEAITSNLAMMLSTEPSKLSEAGIQANPLPMPSAMYLDGDGQIIFQYGEYEIAPYSMGIISVPVSPYQLRDVLTAQGTSLLSSSL